MCSLFGARAFLRLSWDGIDRCASLWCEGILVAVLLQLLVAAICFPFRRVRNHCMSIVGRECRPLLAMSVGAQSLLDFRFVDNSVCSLPFCGRSSHSKRLSLSLSLSLWVSSSLSLSLSLSLSNCHGPSWWSHRRFCTDLDWSWTWASVSGCSREMCKSSEERAEHERPFYRKKCHQKTSERKHEALLLSFYLCLVDVASHNRNCKISTQLMAEARAMPSCRLAGLKRLPPASKHRSKTHLVL